MSTIDIIIGALLLFGLYKGFTKGLFVEIASIVALIAGVYGAIHFSYYVANKLHEHVEWDEQYINIIAFGSTFLIIIILINLAGKAFTKLADFAALGILNKILGALFGGLKVGLILSILLIVFSHVNNTVDLVKQEQIDNSILYKPVRNLAPIIFPDFIQEEGNKQLQKIEDLE